MAARWYVLHTYSGWENKIEKLIKQKLESDGPESLSKDIVKDIKVPQEMEVKDGKKRMVKFFPGYVMLEMDLPEGDWKRTCQIIRNIDGVTGFVGTPADRKPTPLSDDEARGILQKAGELKGEKPIKTRQTFSPGDKVKITDGPFDTFDGIIEEVNTEKNKLKVMVGIFGRSVPVEVDLMQVEKV
jgi:transcriptional antiterminator NusG